MSKRRTRSGDLVVTLALVLVVLLCSVVAPTQAQAAAPQPPVTPGVENWRVSAVADGTVIDWSGPTTGPASLATEGVTLLVGDRRLPVRLLALRVADDGVVAPRLARVASVAWNGQLAAHAGKINDEVTPPVLAGAVESGTRQAPTGADRYAGRSLRPGASETIDLAADAVSTPAGLLPASPLVVLRQGRLRGTRIVVLALSPFFARQGEARALTSLRATIPGAVPLDASTAALLASSGAFLAAAPPPANPLAATDALRVRTAHPGIQRIMGSALESAGWHLDQLDISKVHLWHNGSEVPLDALDASSGVLASSGALRFYASQVGDRWNATETYWLTVERTPGVRMALRSVPPGSATLTEMALQTGRWRQPLDYESMLAGPGGDHWFSAELGRTPYTVTLGGPLPALAGAFDLTLTGYATGPGQHQVVAALGGASRSAVWSGEGNWSQTLSFGGNQRDLVLTLVPGDSSERVLLDQVRWSRSVALDAAGLGAAFTGRAGSWHYRVTQAPAQATLYDVTVPETPQVLVLPAGQTLDFEDGPQAHSYLLTGAGTLYDAVVAAHAPTDLSAALNADALYIAPAVFAEGVAPLLALRQGQGYHPRVVDVQAIYDAWSYGQVTPDAIRDFLRYAAATWSRPPVAVTLVGDGTRDPLNYTGRNNTDYIPPYMAMVDPYGGETACETCYGQLDGASPLDDALPDLAVGRLPVKNASDLQIVVRKLVGYETAHPVQDWQRRTLFVTDNYRDSSGTPDPAGNFGAEADKVVAGLPSGLEVRRMSYNPYAPDPQPWDVADPVLAHQRTMELLSGGAGLATYLGHSHQWQWAVTDPQVTPPYLLGLNDIDHLTNEAQLPILLEMTCLTAAFDTPAYSGTTMDERFLLHPNGGAVAVWGSSGLGLLQGHDRLQTAFHQALWRARPGTATLGSLTTAGYLALFTDEGCCQSLGRTFLLLGDPLTRAQIYPWRMAYLPSLARR